VEPTFNVSQIFFNLKDWFNWCSVNELDVKFFPFWDFSRCGVYIYCRHREMLNEDATTCVREIKWHDYNQNEDHLLGLE
jgi:hypothetical protein